MEKEYTLRARGLAPKANYIIKPVVGSIIGDVPSLRDNAELCNEVVERILASSGARKESNVEKRSSS